MLTNDQCIEIAEKVWGMKRDYAYHGDHYLPSFVNGLLEPTAVRDIGDEVNSWEGFGRTVEAMAERKWVLTDGPDKHGDEGLMLLSHIGDTVLLDTNEDWENPRRLIEATHLAALESLRDN